MSRCYVAKFDYITPDTMPGGTRVRSSTFVTKLFSTVAMYSRPTDTFPTRVYEARLINPGSIESHMWKPDDQTRHAVTSFGFIELVNSDGGLDYLLDGSIDGRQISIYLGDTDSSFDTFTLLYTANMTKMTVTESSIQITLIDDFVTGWDRILNRTQYGGTNTLPNGVDGTSELKGKYQPMAWGRVYGYSPPCVNTSLLIYHLSKQPANGGWSVLVNGVAITTGVNRINTAALQANTPAAGTFDYCLSDPFGGAYIRLGSSPGSAVITIQSLEDPTLANCHAVAIVKRMMEYTLTGSYFTLPTLGMDTAFDDGIIHGYYCGTDGVTLGTAVDAILNGIQASCCRKLGGDRTWRVRQLTDPRLAGSFAANFTPSDLVPVSGSEYIQIMDKGSTEIPPYMVRIKANRYWTVLTGANVASSLSDATRADLGQEWRVVSYSDTTTGNPNTSSGRHLNTVALDVDSMMNDNLADGAVIQLEATRVQKLFDEWGSSRKYVKFSISNVTLITGTIDLGSFITLTFPRYGFDTARNMIITGVFCDFMNERLDIFAWG